jgi:glyoxylase-like metal-dependent hydrolase (beta-lactamase superfamily II)
MYKTCLAALVLGSALASAAAAQDAKAILAEVSKAMGVGDNFGSVRYTGSGTSYAFGQAYDAKSPWPKFNVTKYERVIDFDAGASRQRMTRTQAENPPKGGGQQPLNGEQTQNTLIGTKQPWSTQFEMWVTPWGFIEGAKAAEATAVQKTDGGKKYTVVSYIAAKKYKVAAYIDEQNLIQRIETQIDTPVLGDTPVAAVFTDYKDSRGLKYPGRIVETEGDFPILDLTLTGARKNIVAGVTQTAIKDDTGEVVDQRLVAPDVYYFTGGTHNSVVLGFNDYVIVVEGPLDEARSEAVISEVKKIYFNKPIRYLINTHQHFDHAGGIRTYAAEGATIVTYLDNKPYYEKTFAMPRTLAPDKLAQSKKKAVIEAVTEKRVFTDGTHELDLYHVQNSGHNGGMLIGYLPKAGIVIEADLYTAPEIVPNIDPVPVASGTAAAPPPPPSPYTISLVDNLERLKLDYDTILGLHGREANKNELLKAAGKAPAPPASAAK